MNKSEKVQVLVRRNQLYFPIVHLLDFVDNLVDINTWEAQGKRTAIDQLTGGR